MKNKKSRDIFSAIEENNVEELKKLISSGADVNGKDVHGDYPLQWAAYYRNRECLRELIQAGAEVNKQNKKGWRAIHWAAYHGSIECLRELISSGAEISHLNHYNQTAKELAKRSGHKECVELIENFEFMKREKMLISEITSLTASNERKVFKL